ncbi:putative uncharacterized protein [Pseudomonas sp. StFLB209]|uniref:DUF4376 domain-containing protein n=1 Tax=Pseudomonas sp. StFLB209 TaxID=1028989 RepID=UPI0004F7005F|nr:DUF4376 domain-containing protein [Pseudomonas sp. StFLB209]BAP41288.1 putative uncharacterized protein [Pseudomonas sp. StFLB209]
MYQVQSFADGQALIINTEQMYESYWLADSAEAAEALAVGLNQPDLHAELASHRFTFETTGLTLANGLQILTDRESQAQLGNAYTTLKHGLIPDTDWKAVNGWQVVTLAEIEPIAKSMAAHVRGCFRGERAVSELINAAKTLDDIRAINIAEQFFAHYQVAYDEVMVPA